jgi:hypothetical protein
MLKLKDAFFRNDHKVVKVTDATGYGDQFTTLGVPDTVGSTSD